MKYKILPVILTLCFISTAAVVSAQSAEKEEVVPISRVIGEWIGTAWINTGSVVSPSALKSNLDFLYNYKAPKPQTCSGEDFFLGWINNGWTCTERTQPRACSFNGTSVASGNSITAYNSTSVAFGQTCQSEQRTCTNGVLSGTFEHAACTGTQPGTCVFNGTTVPHGDSITAFASASVPFGQTCQSQQRACTNGVLSGGYQASGCAVVPPASCAFNSQSIGNGDSVVAYEFANVPFGETCQAQERTCNNGVLSGSYGAPACTVQPASTCVFNGQTLQNGETVEAYVTEEVAFGQTCQSETRTCNNGVLSGSNTAEVCEVLRQDPITFRQQDFVVSSTQYYCEIVEPGNFFMGEPATREEPRDSNNQCPGFFSIEATRVTNHLMNHSGIRYRSNRYTGINHDGLSADAQTLSALCRIKGYNYVVGQAPESNRGFRTLKTPENNRWVYGSGTTFSIRGAGRGLGFNNQYGYVTCSDSLARSGGTTTTGSGGGSNGGGENNGGGRDINLSPNESR